MLEDPETGARLLVDTGDPRVQKNYARWVKSARDEAAAVRKLRLDTVELRAGADSGEALGRFFPARARRVARSRRARALVVALPLLAAAPAFADPPTPRVVPIKSSSGSRSSRRSRCRTPPARAWR